MNDSTYTRNAAEPDSVETTYGQCNGEPAFIIASREREAAWLAVSVEDEIELDEWA